MTGLLLTRRRALQLGGALAGTSLLGCGTDLGIPADASFDDVLDALHRTDVEFGGGLSNHAPMAIEALVTLGRSDRIVPWIEGYEKRLLLLEVSAPLDAGAREDSLGDYERRAEWIAYYEDALASASPAEVLAREMPLLANAFYPADWHGVIRSAHAMRSLAREDTPSRRRELAFGLGYWAARYQTFAGVAGARAETGLTVAAALERITPIPVDQQVRDGLIADRFAPLEGDGAFVDVVEAFDPDAQPVDEIITALTEAAARLFVNEGANNITLLHAITGVSALRLLLPSLDSATQRVVVGQAFQAVAASYAAAASAGSLAAIAGSDRDDLRERAGAADDEHAIKLGEALLREVEAGASAELIAAGDTVA